MIEAQNTSGIVSKGVEASLRLNYRPIGFIGTYTFTRAGFKSGLKVPYQPEHVVSGTVTFNIRKLISLSIGASWQSSFFMDQYEGLKQGCRTDLFASLNFYMTHNIILKVWGSNLLNQEAWVDVFQNPLPGRVIFGSLVFNYEGGRR